MRTKQNYEITSAPNMIFNETRGRKHRLKCINHQHFRVGELYLFHPTDPRCPAKEALWAIIDKQRSSQVYLESSSRSLQTFRLWHKLSSRYHYYRLASRQELRHYIESLCWFESSRKPNSLPRR